MAGKRKPPQFLNIFSYGDNFFKKNYPHFSPFILQIPSIYLFNMRLDVCPGKELLHVDNVLAGQTHTYFFQQGSMFWYCYRSNW